MDMMANFTQSLFIGIILSKTRINESIPITEIIPAQLLGMVYLFNNSAKKIPTTK
ncbi:hypothetical protein EMIT036CA2_30200 [Chryseobacterium sp. IT-36CA2]